MNIQNIDEVRPPYTTPEDLHPFVRMLFQGMSLDGVTYYELSQTSGINYDTIKNWRRHHMPRVDQLEKALDVLGLELFVRPKRGAIMCGE